MANMDNNPNQVNKKGYSLSGHPVKDKLQKFLDEAYSDINVLNASLGAVAGSSDITTLNSDVVILKKSTSDLDVALSTAVGYQGNTVVDPSASTFKSAYSQAIAAVSNTTAEISNAVGFMGGKLGSDPAASTLKSYLSTVAADYSNTAYDLTNNVKSNITAIDDQFSDLRAAVSNMKVKYASDAWANVSDIKVSMSDFFSILSNSLIAD